MSKFERLFLAILSDLFPIVIFIYTLTNAVLSIIHSFNCSDPFHHYLLGLSVLTFLFCLPGMFIGIGHGTFIISGNDKYTLISPTNYLNRIATLIFLATLKLVHQTNVDRTSIDAYLIPSAMIFVSMYSIFITIFRHMSAYFIRRAMHTTIAFNFLFNSIIILALPLVPKAPLVFCQYISLALCVLAIVTSITFQYYLNCKSDSIHDLPMMEVVKRNSPSRLLLFISMHEKTYPITEEFILTVFKEFPDATDLHLYLFNYAIQNNMDLQYNPSLIHSLITKAHNNVLAQMELLLILDYASKTDAKDCASLKKLNYIETLDYMKSCAANFWNYVLNDMPMAASTVFWSLYRNAAEFNKFYVTLDEGEKNSSFYKTLYSNYAKLMGTQYENLTDLTIEIEKEGQIESDWIRPFDGVFIGDKFILQADHFGQFKYESGQKFIPPGQQLRIKHGNDLGKRYIICEHIFAILVIVIPLIVVIATSMLFFVIYAQFLHHKPYSFNSCHPLYSCLDTFFWDVFLNSSQQTMARVVNIEAYEEFINETRDEIIDSGSYGKDFNEEVKAICEAQIRLLDILPDKVFEEIAKTQDFFKITTKFINLSIFLMDKAYDMLVSSQCTLSQLKTILTFLSKYFLIVAGVLVIISLIDYIIFYRKHKIMFSQLLMLKKQVVNRLYKLINDQQFSSSRKIKTNDISYISFFHAFVISHFFILALCCTAAYLWMYVMIHFTNTVSVKYHYAMLANFFPMIKVTSLYTIGTINQHKVDTNKFVEWLNFCALLSSTIVSTVYEPSAEINTTGRLPPNFMIATKYSDILKLSDEVEAVHFLTILSSINDLVRDLLDNIKVSDYNMSYMQLHALHVYNNDTYRFITMNKLSWDWDEGVTNFLYGISYFILFALVICIILLITYFNEFKNAVTFFFRMINGVPDEVPFDDGTRMELFKPPLRSLMSQVLETIPIGIVTTNKDGIVISANESALKKFPGIVQIGHKLDTSSLSCFTHADGETRYYEVTTGPSKAYGLETINSRFTGDYTTIIKDITLINNLESTVNSISRDLEKLRDEVYPAPVSNMRDSCVYLENMIVVDIAFPENVTVQEVEELANYAKEYAEQTTTFFTSNTFPWSFSFMFTAYESIVRERQNFQDAVEFTKQIFKKRADVRVGIATADGGFCIINKSQCPGVLIYSTAMTTANCLTRFSKPGGVTIEWQALMMISDIDANPDSVRRENLSGKDVDFCIFDSIASFTQKTL